VKSIGPIFVASLVIAAASIGGPIAFRYEPNLSRATKASFCLGAVWLVVPFVWSVIYWQCEIMRNFNASPWHRKLTQA
jgi:hypothetical protein